MNLTKKLYHDMGKERDECRSRSYFRNNSKSVISIHEMLRNQKVYRVDESRFKNFEGALLNIDFLKFEEVWDQNMASKFNELSGLPVKVPFKRIRIFSDVEDEDLIDEDINDRSEDESSDEED